MHLWTMRSVRDKRAGVSHSKQTGVTKQSVCRRRSCHVFHSNKAHRPGRKILEKGLLKMDTENSRD